MNKSDTQTLGSSLILMGVGILIGNPEESIDGRLSNAIQSLINPQRDEPKPVESKAGESKYIYGISGLADMLGVSTVTAQKLKNSGKLDPAIMKVGRKLVFDRELAMELATNK